MIDHLKYLESFSQSKNLYFRMITPEKDLLEVLWGGTGKRPSWNVKHKSHPDKGFIIFF